MGGATFRGARLLTTFLFLWSFLLGSLFLSTPAQAAGILEFAKDVLNSTTPGRPDVAHDISFVLPADAEQITPADYVLIELTNFEFISLPNEIVGGFGVPNFSLSGRTIRITNIALLPGSRLQILGATAQNPQVGQSYQVVISIADGSPTGIIRNQATTFANEDGTFISVSATIESPLASVNISGFTSPNAFVTLTENGTAVGTTSASGSGFFSFPIGGLDPGNHTYRLSSTDDLNRSTSQTVIQLFLVGGTVTNASGILLSSTMSLDRTDINPGQTMTATGKAKPLSQINIFTEAPLKSYTANTDVNGAWSYLFTTSELATYSLGEHRIYTIVQDNVGNQSIVSNTLTFNILSSTTDPNPPPSCDISRGDLNCNGVTNLTDFSILLFHWRTDHKKADINNDGIVNLVDFSIMMFYFQR